MRPSATAHACSSTEHKPSHIFLSTCNKIGCDFFVFSGHKIFAPTGIGVVWAKEEAFQHHAAVARRRQHPCRT